jgi:predicted nucleic acid-binding protein
MIKKLKMPIAEVKQIITAINDRCTISIITHEAVQKALDLKEVYGYSYYDSLILAAAVLSDCDYIFSEDLQDGQIIENKIAIVNIFKQTLQQ